MTSFTKKAFRIAEDLLILLIFSFAIGCEDVIDVNLEDSEPMLVIEGYLTNTSGKAQFRVSRSTNFYGPNEVEMVSGASIAITDDLGNADTLIERDPDLHPGEYISPGSFPPHPGRTYHATVIVDGRTFEASAKMEEPILIDSLGLEYEIDNELFPDEDEGWLIHVHFKDPPSRSDYARITISANGEYLPDFYLYDGRFTDGRSVDYSGFHNLLQPGDFTKVELYTLDRTMFFYFLTLSEVWASDEGNDFLDPTPANPNTNWSGGALGYFGAFNISTRGGVLPERP